MYIYIILPESIISNPGSKSADNLKQKQRENLQIEPPQLNQL
jgi:hypothetical protein